MTRPTEDSRSRHGCVSCLAQHRKCDEGRPQCQLCERRNTNCDYTRKLRWTRPRRHQSTKRSTINETFKLSSSADVVNDEIANTTCTPMVAAIQELRPPDIGCRERQSVGSERGSESDFETFYLEPTSSTSPVAVPGEQWILGDSSVGDQGVSASQNQGEITALQYYFDRVSGVLPAYDGPRNPYRKLVIIALTSPVLMDTIISISTAYMYYQGQVPATLAYDRQSRALNSLRESIEPFQELPARKDEYMVSAMNYRLYASRQGVLAAVLLQIAHEILTGSGQVDLHLRCAMIFLHELGYIREPTTSPLDLWLVQRVAITDIVSSFFWHQKPKLPLSFWFFKPNVAFDESEPSFREMTGCPHRILCFLAKISWLAADREVAIGDPEDFQRAYDLETDLRLYGSCQFSKDGETSRNDSWDEKCSGLDTIGECYYWSACLLLHRRVFHDLSTSCRVQFTVTNLIRLIESMPLDHGPDSSLSLPLYLIAHEAVSDRHRSWIRKRNQQLAKKYPSRTRAAMIDQNEELWRRKDNVTNASDSLPEDVDREIAKLETRNGLFIC